LYQLELDIFNFESFGFLSSQRELSLDHRVEEGLTGPPLSIAVIPPELFFVCRLLEVLSVAGPFDTISIDASVTTVLRSSASVFRELRVASKEFVYTGDRSRILSGGRSKAVKVLTVSEDLSSRKVVECFFLCQDLDGTLISVANEREDQLTKAKVTTSPTLQARWLRS
jgi:hypothetical protein